MYIYYYYKNKIKKKERKELTFALYIVILNGKKKIINKKIGYKK